MAFFVKENNISSLIADNPLAAGSTTINITTGDGADFPNTFPYRLTIWNGSNTSTDIGMEIVHCTGRTVDALTVLRGQEDTSDIEHSQGEKIELLITAGLFDDATYGVEGNIITHIADTSTHGITSDIVGRTETQTITNKSIDSDNNTITNIVNADVKSTAAIVESKSAFDDSTGHDHSGAGSKGTKIAAANVPIADGGSIITATDVEAALQENRTALDVEEVALVTHMADTTTHGTGTDYIAKTSKSSQIPEFAATKVVARSGVCDYLCDGTADDVQINAAIASGAGLILIKGGTYDITAQIAINTANITLAGVGNETKLVSNGSTTNLIGIGATKAHVKDMSLDCSPNTTTCYGVKIYGGGTAEDVIVENLYIKQPYIGVYIGDKITNLIIRNCHVDTAYWQGMNVYANGCFVTENTVHDTVNEFGIVVTGIKDITITHNVTYGNTADGIEIGYPCENAIISHNHSYDDRSGILLMSKKLNTIPGYIKDVIVSDNIVDYPKRGGIVLTIEDNDCKCHNILISNNIIKDGQNVSWKAGIFVTAGLFGGPSNDLNSNIKIVNNIVENFGDNLIDIRSTDGLIQISDNILQTATYGGIALRCSDADIFNNRIDNITSGASGYGLRVWSGTGNQMYNNHITSCGVGTMYITNTSVRMNNKGKNPYYHGTNTADPTAYGAGDTYYNTTTNKLRFYNGAAWGDV